MADSNNQAIMRAMSHIDPATLKADIRRIGLTLGFTGVGFASVDLGEAETRLMDWLARGYHGSMDCVTEHGARRARPAELIAGTRSVISVRLDYLTATESADTPTRAVISRYARGRDYHRILRKRLQAFADRLATKLGPFQYRAFTDSAPVMEVELAVRRVWAGEESTHSCCRAAAPGFSSANFIRPRPAAGYAGKRTLWRLQRLSRHLPDAGHTMSSTRVAAYPLFTIEHAGAIPEALRP